jgi:hypothetical protein
MQVLVAQALLPVWFSLELKKGAQARVPVPHDFFRSLFSRDIQRSENEGL